MTKFFVFDAESIGLSGEACAIGGGVYLEDGTAQWEFTMACPQDACKGNEAGRKWVAENVPAMDWTHNTPKEMRDSFWKLWEAAKAQGAIAMVECGWPVEANLMSQCIGDDPRREFQGPYPLHEIATYMTAAGMDAMATYPRLKPELPAHNPQSDARLSARLLAIAISKLVK
jgi:hypothetical protein